MVVHTCNPNPWEAAAENQKAKAIFSYTAELVSQRPTWAIWKHTPVFLALRRLKQGNYHHFESNLVQRASSRPAQATYNILSQINNNNQNNNSNNKETKGPPRDGCKGWQKGIEGAIPES